MKFEGIFIAALAALCAFGQGAAAADSEGDNACVVDKWDEKTQDNGGKLVDYTGRCIIIPDDKTPPVAEPCAGVYKYEQDGSWKGTGTCTLIYKGGDTILTTWEEGSSRKEGVYTITGGTGKYKGAKGGGSYTYVDLAEKIQAGRIKGEIIMP